ncbi:O-antigen ligase family protein [Planococcus sp. APC 3900]|uniref:O-antigen ligase family protein n=1 Tax=Planococcus sp. APC 3900 TaxID=3035191 RepID=UPI0025B3FB50|nr:O-antigen ligase family protein [Planococcus sp. APC 3900]MDN3437278.1 O-antigen ligase family protein [Planococcus sp. APC 3900]
MIQSKTVAGKSLMFFIALSILTMFLPPISLSIVSSTLTIYVGEIFLWVTLFLWIILIFNKRSFTFNGLGKYSLGLVLMGFLSLINTTDYGRFFIGFSTYVEVFLIIIMFSDIKLVGKFQEKIFMYYLYSGGILSLFIIGYTLIENEGSFLVGNKIILDIGASNYLASILLLPFFIVFTQLTKSVFSVKGLILVLLIGAAIIFTASRSALLIMIGLAFLFLLKDILFNRSATLVKRVTSLTTVLVGSGLTYFIGREFIAQMIEAERFSNLSEQANLLSRFDIFEEYFLAFSQNPFLGKGFLNVDGMGEYYLAHNLFLQVLGDNGFIFFVLFVLLLVSIYRMLGRSFKSFENPFLRMFVLGFRRGFLAIIIHGMLEPNFGTKLFMLYLFIGIGIIIATNYSSETNMKY